MLRRSCIQSFFFLCTSYLMSVPDDASFYTYSSSPGKGLGFPFLSLKSINLDGCISERG